MAGIPTTGEDINNVMGDISRSITSQLRRADNMKRFLDRFTAQDLQNEYGLSLEEAALLKSAATEMAAIDATFQANRAFIDQLAGLGDV